MAILYALVARGTTVLAEYTTPHTNIPTVTRSLLQKIDRDSQKMSVVHGRYVFHYCTNRGLIFLCMAEESSKRRIPFAFLDDAKERFAATYGTRGETADDFEMQSSFSKVLRNQMEYFNSLDSDSIDKVATQLDEVKGIMVENINKLLDRGEHLDTMADKTTQLTNSSQRFVDESRNLKRSLWMNGLKKYLFLGVCVLIMVVLLIVAFKYVF